jgi:hypothetical protein
MQFVRSRCFLVTVVSVAGVIFSAGAAHAATAFVGAGALSKSPDTVNFVADPGEINSVTVELVINPIRVEIHDAGATITAGAGCSSDAFRQGEKVWSDHEAVAACPSAFVPAVDE